MFSSSSKRCRVHQVYLGTAVLSPGLAPFGHLAITHHCGLYLCRCRGLFLTHVCSKPFQPVCRVSVLLGVVGSTQALDSGAVTEWQKSCSEAYLSLRLTTHGVWIHLLVLFICTVFSSTMLSEPHGPGRQQEQTSAFSCHWLEAMAWLQTPP